MADNTSTAPEAKGASLAELAQQEQQAKEAAASESADESQESESSDDDGESEDGLGITKFYDDAYGRQRSKQFKDDADFFRWVDQMESEIGKRNEDALVGKRVREQLTENPDAISQLLGGKLPKGGTPAPADSEEFDLHWVTQDENGKVIPAPGAPPDTMTRWAARQRKIEKFAANPDKFVEQAMAKKLKELEEKYQATQDTLVQQQDLAEIQGWCSSHRGALYLEGDYEKGLTRQGQQIVDSFDKIKQARTNIEILNAILPLVTEAAPKVRKREVPSKAIRRPGVATQPPPNRDIEETMREAMAKGRSLADIFREEAEKNAEMVV